jgi:protein FAM32A
MSNPSSSYANVQKGSLKLKKSVEPVIKKKKKREKEKDLMRRMMEHVERSVNTASDSSQDVPEGGGVGARGSAPVEVDARTSSEIAFERAKERRTLDEMMKKPIKTHKERIMEFNEHLDKLSEHYDIPKVSWTK